MKSLKTTCVHAGTLPDEVNNGINSPIYTSTSYEYLDSDETVYPRYFNIPNTAGLGEKIAALEGTEAGMVFSSGMAAISTALFALLKSGDHAVFQTGLYGGTFNFVSRELEPYGIDFDIAGDNSISTLKDLIKPNTRLIYIETPSNPLLMITDIEAVATLARERDLISVIDNTFASPINQNPASLGIDIVIHSATKYLSGHSDICAGAISSSNELMSIIRKMALSLGGSLNAQTVYLLERSIKTLAIRVEQQNKNAGRIAEWLKGQKQISNVYYPGLKDHPGHEIAKMQMSGYGGMLSFELAKGDPVQFQNKLKLIKPSVSLGGVDTIICSPVLTSHRHLTDNEKIREGITEGLLRLSVGIEDVEDIMKDLQQAF
jgi:cysteine-S-conjugate beta-lyase